MSIIRIIIIGLSVISLIVLWFIVSRSSFGINHTSKKG